MGTEGSSIRACPSVHSRWGLWIWGPQGHCSSQQVKWLFKLAWAPLCLRVGDASQGGDSAAGGHLPPMWQWMSLWDGGGAGGSGQCSLIALSPPERRRKS